MGQAVQILLIEDSPLFVTLTKKMLVNAKNAEFAIECVDNLADGIERLAQGGIDAVLLDLTLPDSHGLETFLKLHAMAQQVPTVIYTSVDDEELSLAALNHGASDYLVKSEVNANWLARSLIYAIQRSRSSQASEDKSPSDAAETQVVTERSEHERGWVVKVAEKRLVHTIFLDQLKTSLVNLLGRSDCDLIEVDLSQVDYISNAAISMLLIVHKRTVAADKRLALIELKPQVHEQFSSRRFDRLFNLKRA